MFHLKREQHCIRYAGVCWCVGVFECMHVYVCARACVCVGVGVSLATRFGPALENIRTHTLSVTHTHT